MPSKTRQGSPGILAGLISRSNTRCGRQSRVIGHGISRPIACEPPIPFTLDLRS